MTQSCAYCRAEVRDTTICGRCVRVTDAHLADMPKHAVDVHTAMQRMVNMVEKNDGGRSAEEALVFNEAAAETLHDMRASMVSWCRLLWEERRVPLPDRNTIAAISGHLRANLTILASHPAGGELVSEVANLVRRIMSVIDSPLLRARVELGPCVEIVGSDPCPGPVIAFIYADGDMMSNWTCVRCKREWEPPEWRRVGPMIAARKEAA